MNIEEYLNARVTVPSYSIGWVVGLRVAGGLGFVFCQALSWFYGELGYVPLGFVILLLCDQLTRNIERFRKIAARVELQNSVIKTALRDGDIDGRWEPFLRETLLRVEGTPK